MDEFEVALRSQQLVKIFELEEELASVRQAIQDGGTLTDELWDKNDYVYKELIRWLFDRSLTVKITGEPVYELKSLEQTCFAAPDQWCGEFTDGDSLFVHNRWGYLFVQKGYEKIFGWNIGDISLNEERMLRITGMRVIGES